ncbi:hypothetical protein D3C73_1280720 [compost metagenome]
MGGTVCGTYHYCIDSQRDVPDHHANLRCRAHGPWPHAIACSGSCCGYRREAGVQLCACTVVRHLRNYRGDHALLCRDDGAELAGASTRDQIPCAGQAPLGNADNGYGSRYSPWNWARSVRSRVCSSSGKSTLGRYAASDSDRRHHQRGVSGTAAIDQNCYCG